jgi:hypothetical protein
MVSESILDPLLAPMLGDVSPCCLGHPCLSTLQPCSCGHEGVCWSPTSASDMTIIEFIRVRQSSSYELTFGSELSPNSDCKMVLEPIVGCVVSPYYLGHSCLSSCVILSVRECVGSPTSANDMTIIEFTRVRQSPSYELAFENELSPNSNSNILTTTAI